MVGIGQNLHISDEAFEGMRHDADRVLQRLLKNMVDKESLAGSITIKIDVLFTRDYIPNTDPEIQGETRCVLSPSFSHKIGSVMQIKDEAKGGINYEGMEMVWDDDANEYVVKPIANTSQRSTFDADFTCVNDDDIHAEQSGNEEKFVSGAETAALPEPTDEETEETEDLSDTFDAMNPPEDMPFYKDDDDYDYEEPEEF